MSELTMDQLFGEPLDMSKGLRVEEETPLIIMAKRLPPDGPSVVVFQRPGGEFRYASLGSASGIAYEVFKSVPADSKPVPLDVVARASDLINEGDLVLRVDYMCYEMIRRDYNEQCRVARDAQ